MPTGTTGQHTAVIHAELPGVFLILQEGDAMYIDKLAPIIGKITNYQWYNEREEELQMAMELKDNKKAAELLEIMQNKEDEERAEAEKQYTESFSDNPDRIFQDFQEVIDGFTQQNFEEWFETTKKHFPHLITTSDKWVECCEYIRRLSAVQLRVIEHYGLNLQDAYHTIAVKAAEWYEPPEHEEEKRPEIRTGGKKPDTIIFPTDKINSVLYSGLDKGSHPIGVEKSGSKEKITTCLTIDFDALENSTGITFKKLTPFDKRVYIAAGALLQAGNKYFSATQLYRAMGGTGSPAAYQIKNIEDAKVGGLGISFMRRIFDEMTYHYGNEGELFYNRLKLGMKLASA